MIRLTSRVVQQPASGFPARNHKVRGKGRQEAWYEPMSALCFSLAGAKPGSASTNGKSGLLLQRVVRGVPMTLMSGLRDGNKSKALSAGENNMRHAIPPQVYCVVPDALTNVSNHLVNAEIVEVVGRDDLEPDDSSSVRSASLCRGMRVCSKLEKERRCRDARSSCTGCRRARSYLTRGLLGTRRGRCRA